MTDHSNFMTIVNSSETVSQRWAELTEKAIADARNMGVTIEPTDVLDMRELRLAAMGSELDSTAYQNELMALPALSSAARKKQIAEGDAEARSAAVSDVTRGKEGVHHSHRTADAARRLSEARALGVATPPPEQDSLSRNERLEMLKDVDNAATRLSLARKWGLV